MSTDDSLIVKVILRYCPDWDAPEDRAEWVSCLCPFHGDSRPSATVSFRNDAFNCFTCGEKGDALAILMRKEVIDYQQALEVAERLSPGSRQKVSAESPGKPRRRAFGESGTDRGGLGNREDVQSGLRRRTFGGT